MLENKQPIIMIVSQLFTVLYTTKLIDIVESKRQDNL